MKRKQALEDAQFQWAKLCWKRSHEDTVCDRRKDHQGPCTWELVAIADAREATIHMAVDRLGGVVEDMPTHRGNFLQRIDALVLVEAAMRVAILQVVRSSPSVRVVVA